MIVENFLELVDIEYIEHTEEYTNMVDISVDVDESFLLSNGFTSHNSAISSFRKYRDPQMMGAFALRGKFANVSEMSNSKLVLNKEVVNLMASIGLKLGQPVDLKSLRYGKILLYMDADCLEENTNIMTDKGPKKISEINYGDKVLTHRGEYKNVNNVVKKDISRYIKISVNGNTFNCSEDHKLIVVRSGEVIEIEAKNLKYTDHLLIKEKIDDYIK